MISLSQAKFAANKILEALHPYCDKIHIAGSIRREKPSVKDIEIVCQPKKELKKDPSKLFDEGQWMVMDDFEITLDYITAAVEKGNVNGRYMKLELKNGMPLDLFMPHPSDYIRQLVIRTGSSDYVHHVIAAGWKIKGWCGTADGLRLISECTGKQTSDGKTIWKCTASKPSLPPVWETEEQFFAWLGIPYTPPYLREIHNYSNIVR